MTTWTFFGKIYPERVPISIGRQPKQEAVFESEGLKFAYIVTIHISQLTVELTLLEGSTDIFTLRNIAADVTRTHTDLVSFVTGAPFEVDIISAVRAGTNDWHVFGGEIPALANLGKEIKVDGKIASLPLQHVSVSMALADFRKAMRDPVGTGFYCFRAIESMMQAMKDGTDNDNAAWTKLRDRLLIDRSVIDFVKSYADYPRHGKPSAISDADRGRIFRFTQEIVSRYLTYLSNDKKALMETEFTLLKGDIVGAVDSNLGPA